MIIFESRLMLLGLIIIGSFIGSLVSILIVNWFKNRKNNGDYELTYGFIGESEKTYEDLVFENQQLIDSKMNMKKQYKRNRSDYHNTINQLKKENKLLKQGKVKPETQVKLDKYKKEITNLHKVILKKNTEIKKLECLLEKYN